MTNILKLVETDSDFLEKAAHELLVDGETWMSLPFWFKKKGNGVYEVVTFDKLPDYVKEKIKSNRELKPNI